MRTVALVSLVLAGCATPPDAYDICIVNRHAGWQEIQAPAERDELMQLIPQNDLEAVVAASLALNTGQQEAWFRNHDGRIMACAYTPDLDVCDGGSARIVEFSNQGSAWTAAGVRQGVCVY